LRKAGIPDDRMGIAGFGQHQPISPNDTAESRQKNRRVEIFVVGPDTPVVGWSETLGTLYRYRIRCGFMRRRGFSSHPPLLAALAAVLSGPQAAIINA